MRIIDRSFIFESFMPYDTDRISKEVYKKVDLILWNNVFDIVVLEVRNRIWSDLKNFIWERFRIYRSRN